MPEPKRFYTLVFAHDARGRVRKLTLPSVAIKLILFAALIGCGTIVAGVFSYAQLLLKVTDYNALRAEREQLRGQNRQLQGRVSETAEKLSTLESLASEVAASYGLLQLRQTPFGAIENAAAPSAVHEYRDSVARFRFLRRNATAVALYANGARPLPGQSLEQLVYTPSLWPVHGQLVGGFGDRMDPFNGEGAFHSGVDISADYGSPVLASADGFIVAASGRTGYGDVVVVDHGFGVTTWYAHLSRFRAYLGQAVRRGDIIGYVGSSGRATGPHLHYEVRLHEAPLNPWRFLRAGNVLAAGGASIRAGD